MFDPITKGACLTTASTAFAGLKRAFQAGRDIESMSKDLSRWMGAVSDIEQKEKSEGKVYDDHSASRLVDKVGVDDSPDKSKKSNPI